MLRISMIAGLLLIGAGAASATVPEAASSEALVSAASVSVKPGLTVIARRGADDRGRDDRGGKGRGSDDRGRDDRGRDDRGGKGRGADDGANHG